MQLSDILEDLQTIKDKIAADRMDLAIKLLLPITRNNYQSKKQEHEVIVFSRFYQANKKEYTAGEITHTEMEARLSRKTKSLLEMIDAIENDVQLEIKRQEQKRESNATLLDHLPKLQDSEQEVEMEEKDLTQSLLPRALLTPEVVLEVHQLEKRYKNTNFHLSVEKLQLKAGTINTLVGENATGKTTLIRILAGELAADKGILEYPLLQENASRNWVQIKKQIAYIPQYLPPWYKDLYTSLCFEAVSRGVAPENAPKEVDYIVFRLGLGEYIDRKWSELSAGYKLRFYLAKALVWRPRLLLIDEPLAHLDVRAQLTVLTDLKKILTDKLYYLDSPAANTSGQKDSLAIFLSSQHIHEIEAISDQILFMRRGVLENYESATPPQYQVELNCFELSCDLPQIQLKALLQQLPCRKIQYTGISVIISTDKSIRSSDVLQFFERQQIALHYFRDISQSIILKFYED